MTQVHPHSSCIPDPDGRPVKVQAIIHLQVVDDTHLDAAQAYMCVLESLGLTASGSPPHGQCAGNCPHSTSNPKSIGDPYQRYQW